jgi:hypothetical protein
MTDARARCPSAVRQAIATRRSSSSGVTVTRPRRSRRRSWRLVAGRVTPTCRATSLIRAPSGAFPRITTTRHCGNVKSNPGRAEVIATVVIATPAKMIRSRDSATDGSVILPTR